MNGNSKYVSTHAVKVLNSPWASWSINGGRLGLQHVQSVFPELPSPLSPPISPGDGEGFIDFIAELEDPEMAKDSDEAQFIAFVAGQEPVAVQGMADREGSENINQAELQAKTRLDDRKLKIKQEDYIAPLPTGQHAISKRMKVSNSYLLSVAQVEDRVVCGSSGSICGSILGPFWVHFGSILGPFRVNFGGPWL